MNIVGKVLRFRGLRNVFLSVGEKMFVLKHPQRYERFSASGFEEAELAEMLGKMCAVEGRLDGVEIIATSWQIHATEKAQERNIS